MEQIINNLLQPDNEIIQQASKDLREAYKKPEAITEICNVAVNSANFQIRQYAFVLLRRRLSKLRNWQAVTKDVQNNIKQGMLKALVSEPEKIVRSSIAQFIGILCRHEFPKQDPWANDLLKFVFESCATGDSHLSEVASLTLNIITDVAPDQLVPHAETICNMFMAAINASDANGTVTTPVIFNILCALANLAPFIQEQSNAKSTYQNLIPYVIKTLQVYAINDAEKFISAFDILENIAENLPALLTPHLALLVEFSLELANPKNTQLDESCRVKGVIFLGWLVRLKKKTIIKMKLIEPIVVVLFELMACAPAEEDDEEEDYFLGSSEVSNPMTCATQTMDILALHVPPEKLIPPLLQLVEPAVKGDDILHKKAAYLCIAVIAEGCSEAICTKYLAPMLECVKAGITNPNALVRNAALFALGQFAEHLQPEISQYANDILPILFEFLHQLCVQLRIDGKEPKHIDRMFYALETFCENLEDALVPYLPIFMERLFEALSPSNSVQLRELAMSCIGAAVTAAKSNMAPYFNQVIEMLKMYLVQSQDENIVALRPSAIDTLAAVAQNIGKDHFLPLAQDSLNYGLQLIAENQEPELKRSCYSLFASIGEVMNQDIAPALPKIIETMLESVRSSEGLVPEYDDDDEDDADDHAALGNGDDAGDEDIDIENSDNEDDDDLLNMAVENAYLDEKEEAIIALRELALNTGAAFAPYIQPAFEEVYKLITYPQEDIRRVCVEALCQFIISLYKLQNVAGTKTALAILIPKISELIRTDEERVVVKASLDAFCDLLDELKSDLFMDEQYKDVIYSCLEDVLNGKVACQFDEPIVDDDEEESEFDEAIIETAGDILPRLGKAMAPQEFSLYFGRLFNYFMTKLQKSKKNEDAESQRAVVIGVISECFAGLKERSVTWMPTLLPLLLDGVHDKSDMVRNNAVYGLGELMLHADAEGFKYYPQALQALSQAVAKEKDANTLDNICGALARLIIANSNLVPLKDVLPVFVQYLPLRQDFDENMSVFKCLHGLYQQGNPVIAEQMEKIILIALSVLMKKQHPNDEVRDFIFNFVKQMRQDFSGQFNAVVTNNPEIAAFVITL